VLTIQVSAILAFSIIVCAGPVWPQMNGGQDASVVKGEIETSQTDFEGYTVQLYDPTRHFNFETSYIHNNGDFEFRQTPFGSYLVTVTDPKGQPVYQGTININAVTQPFIIRLPTEDTSRPISGIVSVKKLQHPPTRKAFDALRAAQKFTDAGDSAKAVASIERSIAISPDYADAWINLAVWHIRHGAFQQSVIETQKAIELAGPSPMTLCNLAFAQASLGQSTEAIQSAEQALRLKPDDAKAHYLLGEILYHSHQNEAEAIRHLELAAPTMPGARAALAKIRGN
jgi:tetratricopeptide (TPR) repeat protein